MRKVYEMRRAGFTLVEVLIAITVATVLGAGILALVLGQNKFYAQNDDAIYAEQSLRAALDLMASELRMASPADLLAAEADSVSVRFDLVRAVVCEIDGSDVDLFVYDSVSNANLPAGFRGTAVSDPYEEDFDYAPGYDGSGAASGTAQTNCEDRGSPVGEPARAYRRATSWPGALAAATDTGSVVRVYGRLTYRFDDSGFGSGLAVWRNTQELVSPFDEDARFQYVMDDGTVQDAVAPADFADVRMIRIDVTATGDGANRYDVEREIQFDVPLRN